MADCYRLKSALVATAIPPCLCSSLVTKNDMAVAMEVDAARSRVNAMLRARPETAAGAHAEEVDDPLLTSSHMRNIQNTWAQGPHAALADVVAVGRSPALNDAVLFHTMKQEFNQIKDRLVRIEENTAAASSKRKKKTEQHFSRSEMRGLVMRFPRVAGGEAHMVIDGAWEQVDAYDDEPEMIVRGDVVRQVAGSTGQREAGEEPTQWERVVPAEHIKEAPFVPDMVLEWEHRERSFVGRILPLATKEEGYMVVERVRAGPKTLLADGQRVRKEEDGSGWARVKQEGAERADVPLREQQLLPEAEFVAGDPLVAGDAGRVGRSVGQLVRLTCSAPERKDWPAWLLKSRPFGKVKGANKSKSSESLVEFTVTGLRMGSETEPGDEVDFVALSIPSEWLERARAGERATMIYEQWPRPVPGRRAQFSHMVHSPTGAPVRREFRGIVKAYDPVLPKVELAMGEDKGATRVWVRRDKPADFSFLHRILDSDEVGSYNDGALVNALVDWYDAGSKKKAAAKPKEDPLPENVPLALMAKLDGRYSKHPHELVATVTGLNPKGGVLLSVPFEGGDEALQLPRSAIASWRRCDHGAGKNDEALRRLVRLERFDDGQMVRLRLKLPKKLGDDGVEVACRVLRGSDDEHLRLSMPGGNGSQLAVVIERSARAYDFLGDAGAEEHNAPDCLAQLASVFLTARGKTPLCAETRFFKIERPLTRKMGDKNAEAHHKAEELLQLCCQYGYLAQDVEPSDKDLTLVFPFPDGQQRTHPVPREYLQHVLFFDQAGETCNAHCHAKEDDAVRVLRGEHSGAHGFVLRVNPHTLHLVVKLNAPHGFVEAELPGADLWVVTRSAEDRSCMAEAMGVPLPSDAPAAPPKTKRAASSSRRAVEEGAAPPKKRRGGSTSPAPKSKQQRKKKADAPVARLDSDDEEDDA